jgi:hypothetical protein
MTAATPGAGHNGPNGTLLNEMFKSYFRIEDDKNSKRQQHRNAIGKLTEQQNEVKTRVKDAGYSLRAFNELLNDEKDRRRVENRRAKLDDDDVEQYDSMVAALGALADTPLGKAALGEEQDEADLRSPAQKKREKARKDKNAALDAVAGGDAPAGNGSETITAGIKPLH